MPSSLYRVFLHGAVKSIFTPATRLVPELHTLLSRTGVITNLDRPFSEKNFEVIRSRLPQTVESSQCELALVVFSRNCTNSSRYLDVLQVIVDCHNDYGLVILPIFYGVDPCDVRNQTGDFGKALEELAEKRFAGRMVPDLLFRWGSILTQATRLPGWDFADRRGDDEKVKVKEIVNDVLKRLDNTLLSITEFPVGLEVRVQEMIEFIKKQSSKVCVVGIWGPEGSGKSTTAKAIYNKIYKEFEHRSFVGNIAQFCEKGEKDDSGLICLQKQLLQDVLGTEVNVPSSMTTISGTIMIEKKLSRKNTLIVLDDVNNFKQLNALCGNGEWLGLGSVLIVTTKEVNLLDLLKVDLVSKMKKMDENKALELFSWHAFRKASPRVDFIELSRNVIAYCEGLPLALEVLGSYLYERTKEEWESALSKLNRIPNHQVKEKLKISYNDLDDDEKNLFIDICFSTDKRRAYFNKKEQNNYGFDPQVGIAVLEARSLIKIDKKNNLEMHDLLYDLGREITCQIHW